MIWGAWFDADAAPPARAAKRIVPFDPTGEVPRPAGKAVGVPTPRARASPIDQAKLGDADPLIQIEDSWLGRGGAAGSVPGLRWDVRWTGGREVHEDVPSWLPAPTHARAIVHDADATGRVTVETETFEFAGRAVAFHLWGKRRVPTLHWIYAPWIGDGSLEIQAVSPLPRVPWPDAPHRSCPHVS